MRRRIVTIDDNSYLMDFENQSFLKIDNESTKNAYNSTSSVLKQFCCIIREEEIIDPQNQRKFIEQIKKWGCVNQDNEEVVPCIYENISDSRYFPFLYVTMLNPANQESSFCYLMDYEGTPYHIYNVKENEQWKTNVVKFEGYQAISGFISGFAVGLKDGYQGIVKQDGSVFWEPEYDYVDIKDIENNHITVKKGDETITILYFKGLNCWEKLSKDYSFLKYDRNNVYGEHFYVKKEENVAIIDSFNKMLIPPIYTNLFYLYECEVFIATNGQGKKGLIKSENYQTIILLQFDYDEIVDRPSVYQPLSDNNSINVKSNNLVIIKNNLQGIGTANGEILIEPIFKDIDILPNTYGEGVVGFIRKSGKNFGSYRYGFINLDGEVILKTYNNMIDSGFEGGKAQISNQYSRKIINKQGEILEEEVIERDLGYYNRWDWKRESWDALTDGQYGECPDEFDVN